MSSGARAISTLMVLTMLGAGGYLVYQKYFKTPGAAAVAANAPAAGLGSPGGKPGKPGQPGRKQAPGPDESLEPGDMLGGPSRPLAPPGGQQEPPEVPDLPDLSADPPQMASVPSLDGGLDIESDELTLEGPSAPRLSTGAAIGGPESIASAPLESPEAPSLPQDLGGDFELSDTPESLGPPNMAELAEEAPSLPVAPGAERDTDASASFTFDDSPELQRVPAPAAELEVADNGPLSPNDPRVRDFQVEDLTDVPPRDAASANRGSLRSAANESLDVSPIDMSLNGPGDTASRGALTPRALEDEVITVPRTSESLKTGNDPRAATYRVQPQDNFWRISKKVYGTSRYFLALTKYNADRVADPSSMRPGTEVSTPPREILESQFPSLIPAAARPNAPANGFPAGGQTKLAPQGDVQQVGFFVSDEGAPMYRVGPDDTLGSISQRHLGRFSRWNEIAQKNGHPPDTEIRLQIGEVLILPDDASRLSVIDEGIIRR